MRSTNIRYLAAIDHLRALAVLLLLFYHGLQLFGHELVYGQGSFTNSEWVVTRNPFLSLIVEGHTSVGLFMVLSGFIFTFGALDRELTYWRFLGNRFLRIYPLYVFVFVASVYAAPQQASLLGMIASLLFLSNTPFGVTHTQFLGVGWAIAVEFQFYLVFPFLLTFLKRYGIKYLFGIVAIFWLYRLFATLGPQSTQSISYWTILGRMDSFIVGMLLGVLYLRRPHLPRQCRGLFPIAMAAPIALVYLLHRQGGFAAPSPTVWFFWPTLEALGWGLFVFSYLGLADALPRIVSRAFSYVGELSFSAYLTHFLILSFLCAHHIVIPFSSDPTRGALLNTLVLGVPLTIGVSSLTWFAIERPFLTLRKPYLVAGPLSPSLSSSSEVRAASRSSMRDL